MKISFIIGAYTLERYADLEELFESIAQQSYTNYEVLFVSDGNVELLQKVQRLLQKSAIKDFHVFLNLKKGLSHVRNLGVGEAQGDIIAFVDDDAVLSKDWAKHLVETFQTYPQAGAVTGNIQAYWMFPKAQWFPKELYWILSCSYSTTPRKVCEVRNGFGTNLSFRKEIFQRVGAFHPALGYNLHEKGKSRIVDGEEVDYCIRMKERTGKTVIFQPKVLLRHKVYPFRIRYTHVLNKCYGDGYAKGLIRSMHPKQLGTESVYLRKIFSEFYPQEIVRFFSSPSVASKRIFFVSSAIVAVALGYLSFTLFGKK